MDPELLRRPWALLRTRWPWTSLAYLALQVAGGWVTWLAAATVVWLPAWAQTWSRLQRRTVRLAGQPPIEPPPRTPGSSWREILYLLVPAALAIIGTVVGAVVAGTLLATLFAPLWIVTGHTVALGPIAVQTPPEQGLAVLAGVLLAGLVLWAGTAAAVALAQLTTVILSPSEAQLERQLRALTDATIKAQDELALERRELERQLHDGAQLHLSVAGARLGLMELELRELPADTRAPMLSMLTETRDQLDVAVDSIRRISAGLVPRVLLDEGLTAALHDLTEPLPVHSRVDCDLPRLPDPVEASIFLILTEAVTNVVKHAAATQLTITATHDPEGIRITLVDNGSGGVDRNGRGVLSMTARARSLGGQLTVHSPAGGPTELGLQIPRAVAS